MKALKWLITISISIIFITNTHEVNACKQIKFNPLEGKTVFSHSHISCTVIEGTTDVKETHQNSGPTFKARHQSTSTTYGTSPGTYERSVRDSPSDTWSSYITKEFIKNSSSSKVTWKVANTTVGDNSANQVYQFVDAGTFAISYTVQFTTGESQLEERELFLNNVSTALDSPDSISVKIWESSDPNPSGLTKYTYRCWEINDLWKLYRLINSWSEQYPLPLAR